MEKREVIIIGSGPAGLTAAIYLARANLKPLLFAGVKWGGQLMLTTDVENYPGFVEGIQGPELMEKFKKQAERFGAEIVTTDITEVDFSKRPFVVTAGEKTYKSKAVLIATGAETKWLGLPNEQRLIGHGVSSCAPCDAFFFRDKKVVVVGGGDSAMEEALVLTKFATEVSIIHRRDEFRASQIMIDRAKANPKIKFILNSEIVDVLGKDKVEGVKIKSKDGSTQDLAVDGMFLAIGHLPVTGIFKGQLELDEKDYIVRKTVGEGPQAFKMMTSVEGVFVAGDVHDVSYKQAVTAAGYGCQAALEVERWIEAQD
ncbi:MAG: Thioredoxin reductase [Candidatus Curtissbacteria bacterium GW2011_GWA1_40_16]|uniref:Thioredoxin reductase n=1 Tax=Candidatus Curtissbacteria bacterium GW2011_GWA1_40_16 TaxID=1618405 RepID=A0A0G0RF35_9BACT|nr:MAG: Thioredoxin reductase [Candidatus Curtissbacteria bacterium GW2011_GWA1_40_16]